MILYHGSVEIIEKPVIIRNEIGRDFGSAFYTTDIKDQAVRWAKRKAMLYNRNGDRKYLPIVNQYDWNEEMSKTALYLKIFEGSSMEWLEMVLKCRSNPTYSHNFDIVIGNIANDNVGETISYVMQGIMRKEDAIERLRFEKINNQIAFCTSKALECLVYKGYF
jgi:hypothetical protein